MARTPLLSALQRAFHLAQESARTGLDPAEIRGRQAEQARSRREFLATGAAAAAALTLPRCASLPAAVRGGPPVIVVGAGIAGLTCAYRLRQAGVPVRVFDAQNRVGGRMFSLRGHFDDGQVAELGGELIDTGHARIRKLAKELHLPLDDLSTDVAAEPEVWFFGGARRTEKEVIENFVPVAEMVAASVFVLKDTEVTYRTKGPAQEIDRLSLDEWLNVTEISGWFRDMLSVGFATEFGLEIDRQSALNLVTMIDPDTRGPFRMYGMSDERFHVRGGNDLIVKTLGTRLEDAIELGCVLERIRRRADGLVECSLRQGTREVVAAAAHVVVAMPFTLLRDVPIEIDLSPAKRRAIAEIGYGTNAKLMVGFSERLWRTRYQSSGATLTDLPYQLSWDTSRHQPGKAGILTNFTGGRHGVELGAGAPGDRATEMAGQLDRIYPGLGALRTKESRFHWPSFPFTRGSYACYLPGQWTSIRGAEGEAAGNLHFAGEHTSLEAQGFMEGGCETGERAAGEVLAALRHPARERVA